MRRENRDEKRVDLFYIGVYIVILECGLLDGIVWVIFYLYSYKSSLSLTDFLSLPPYLILSPFLHIFLDLFAQTYLLNLTMLSFASPASQFPNLKPSCVLIPL